MSGICAIISGGEYTPLKEIAKADFIICCDKGWEYALKENITPNILVGDFDSCEIALPEDISRINLPKEKDDTDTLAAVRWALEHDFREIWLYCALGGRLDHLYANLQTAAFAAEKLAMVRIISPDTDIYLVHNRKITIPAQKESVLSIFALNDICHDVTIQGAKYSLELADLTNTFPIGISNEWLDDEPITVAVREGTLLIMCVRIA